MTTGAVPGAEPHWFRTLVPSGRSRARTANQPHPELNRHDQQRQPYSTKSAAIQPSVPSISTSSQSRSPAFTGPLSAVAAVPAAIALITSQSAPGPRRRFTPFAVTLSGSWSTTAGRGAGGAQLRAVGGPGVLVARPVPLAARGVLVARGTLVAGAVAVARVGGAGGDATSAVRSTTGKPVERAVAAPAGIGLATGVAAGLALGTATIGLAAAWAAGDAAGTGGGGVAVGNSSPSPRGPHPARTTATKAIAPARRPRRAKRLPPHRASQRGSGRA